MSDTTQAMSEIPEAEKQTGNAAPGPAPRGDSVIPRDLKVSRSDDGQYLLLYAGKRLLAIYGAMGADPEVVEFADGRRFAVDALLDLVAAG